MANSENGENALKIVFVQTSYDSETIRCSHLESIYRAFMIKRAGQLFIVELKVKLKPDLNCVCPKTEICILSQSKSEIYLITSKKKKKIHEKTGIGLFKL